VWLRQGLEPEAKTSAKTRARGRQGSVHRGGSPHLFGAIGEATGGHPQKTGVHIRRRKRTFEDNRLRPDDDGCVADGGGGHAPAVACAPFSMRKKMVKGRVPRSGRLKTKARLIRRRESRWPRCAVTHSARTNVCRPGTAGSRTSPARQRRVAVQRRASTAGASACVVKHNPGIFSGTPRNSFDAIHLLVYHYEHYARPFRHELIRSLTLKSAQPEPT